MMKHGKIVLNSETWKMLLVAIIVIVSDDTLWFGTNSNALFVTLKYIILIGTLGVLSFKLVQKFNFNKVSYAGISCIGMCILVLLTGVINSDLRTGYFYKCIILVLSCEIVHYMNFKEFIDKFEKLMFILALVSVVCTLIAEIKLSIFSIFPIFYNSAYKAFYNLGIYMVPVSKALLRNYGIFREPGVYQMFLILVLVFELYSGSKVKISHLLVYILAIVLTFSTTGYIALLFFLLLFFVKKNNFPLNKKYIMSFFVILGLLYMVLYTDLLSVEGMVFDKLFNMQRNTMIARFSSVFANIEIWKESPIFGAGLIKVDTMFPILSYQLCGKATSHNTNTLLCELATYGVIYVSILVCGYIKLSCAMSNRNIERLLILVIIVVLSCGEKLTFSPIIYILLFYGLSLKKKGKIVNQ